MNYDAQKNISSFTPLISLFVVSVVAFASSAEAEDTLSIKIKVLNSPSLWSALDIQLTGPDAQKISGFAELIAPSGMSSRANIYRDAKGRTLARLPVREKGINTISVSVTAPEQYLHLEKRLNIEESGPVLEPIVISPTNPQMFANISGRTFYMIGANVAWASSIQRYDQHFANFKKVGINTVRIWLAPWSLPVSDLNRAGAINLPAADNLERVLNMARKHGLVVQLVFAYHGEFIDRWKHSPWNSANNGPCDSPSDFFTSPVARKKFGKLLEYVAARFGAHEAIFAWELFNEVDLVPKLRPKAALNWHRSAAKILREADPAKRPITSSVAFFKKLPALWKLPQIDFQQAHYYAPDLDGVMTEFEFSRLETKPAFVGEFGGSHVDGVDALDITGARLGAMLWLSLASNSAGTAMPWWWDTQIEPFKLYDLWRPVTRIARKLNRQGKPFRFLRRRIGNYKSTIYTQGIISNEQALLYFFDANALLELNWPKPALPLGGVVEINDLKDGEYVFEVLLSSASEPVQTGQAISRDGVLELKINALSRDFAVFVEPLGLGGDK